MAKINLCPSGRGLLPVYNVRPRTMPINPKDKLLTMNNFEPKIWAQRPSGHNSIPGWGPEAPREAGGSNLMKLPIELTTIIYNKENRIANEYRQPELNQYIFFKMN